VLHGAAWSAIRQLLQENHWKLWLNQPLEHWKTKLFSWHQTTYENLGVFTCSVGANAQSQLGTVAPSCQLLSSSEICGNVMRQSWLQKLTNAPGHPVA